MDSAGGNDEIRDAQENGSDSMRRWTVLSLVGFTLLSVFLLAVAWEFVFKDLIGPLLADDYREESFQEQWKYVITTTVFAALALIIPAVLSTRLATEVNATSGRIKALNARLETRVVERTWDLLGEIAERKQAEKTLRDSEARMRDLVEYTSDWVWEMDADLRFSYFSRRFLEVTGIRPEDVLGKTRRELGRGDVDDEKWHRHLADLEARRPFRDFRYRFVHGDGRTLHFLVNGKPVFDEAGNFRGYRGVGSDITARANAEEQARSARERLAIAIDGLSEHFVLLDPEDRIVLTNAAWRELNQKIGDMTAPGVRFEDHLRAAVKAGLLPEAVGREEEWLRRRMDLHRNPKGPFEVERQDGRWILVNEQRLPDGSAILIISDITGRKRAEEALRESGERYRRIYENTPVMLHSIDKDGRVLSVSDHWLKVLGYERDDVIGKKVVSFLTEESARYATNTSIPQFIKEGRCTDVPLQFVKKNGEVLDILLSGVAERDEAGEFARSLTVLTDITERKRAEEALRESEERFRAVVDNSPTKIHIKDVDGRYTMINRQSEILFGVTNDEARGKTSRDIFPKGVADSFMGHDQAVLQTGRIIEEEEEWVQDDGVHTFLTVKFPIRGAAGEIVAVGAIGTDITRRKRAELLQKGRSKVLERLAAGAPLEEVLTLLVSATEEVEPEMVCSVLLLDKAGKRLRHSAGPSLPDFYNAAIDGLEIGPAEGSCSAAAYTGERVVVADVMTHPYWAKFRKLAKKANLRACWSQPILSAAGEVLGTFAIYYSQPREPDPSDLELIEDAAHLAGIAIERRRAEEALRESEETLRAWMDNTNAAITLKDTEGRYVLTNKHFNDRFKVSHEEIVGKTAYDIFPPEYADKITDQDREVLETGTANEREHEKLLPGGAKQTTILHKFPIIRPDGGYMGIGTIETDITERKRAEEALRASEQRFRDVAEAASDWFWEMDENLRFTFFSGRRQQLTGLPPEEYIGRTRWEAAEANPDEDEKWRHHRATLEAHEAFRDFEYAFTTKDGKTVHNKVSGRPVFDADGVFKGYRGAATDVTEQKEAQAQLIQASKLATLGEMASGIAHELNQPLSVVGMAAELSLMSMDAGAFDIEFVRKKLETIAGQRERMAGIINHMRLFSRKDKTRLAPFDPAESVRGAVGLTVKQLEACGIELEATVPAACRNVSGHPLQLEQVVLNLLNNARDAVVDTMESAGSGNGRPVPRVRVSLVDDKRRKAVVISVADTGGGIPEQALGRIFDPFFTTKEEAQGTGLGLSISYSIIDAMGGRLEAQNADGGAVFRITLPVCADGAGAGDRPPKRRIRRRPVGKPRSHLPRVLFVEDEEAIVKEVAEYLRRKGYEVVTAGNAVEALKLQASRPADMVITDLLMPGMGGNELIRRLRQADPELPIVVMTGHTDFGDEQDIVAEGAFAVLRKPISLRELSEHLQQMVNR